MQFNCGQVLNLARFLAMMSQSSCRSLLMYHIRAAVLDVHFVCQYRCGSEPCGVAVKNSKRGALLICAKIVI